MSGPVKSSGAGWTSGGRRGDRGISHLIIRQSSYNRGTTFVARRTSKQEQAVQALTMIKPSQGIDQSEVRKVEDPTPGPGEVTIDVAYAGINFMDVMARRGDAGYAGDWPYVPGLEVSGTVREVGPGFSTLEVGQRVVGYTSGGGLAEIARTRAEFVVPLPDRVELPIGAAAPLMLTTALLLLTDAARFRPGDSVLVHGASGGIGSAVAQLVPALGGGLRIGTVGRPESVDAALDNGYDMAFAWTEDVPAAVRAATNGVGADIVLDPQGTVLLDTDIAVTAPGGRIVLFGNAGGGQPAALPPFGRLLGGNLAIAGFSITGLWANAPHRASAGLRRVLDLIADGRLNVAITEVGSLADAPATQQLLAEGRGHGKYVVRVNG
jgi:NADPH2:quinone reductase